MTAIGYFTKSDYIKCNKNNPIEVEIRNNKAKADFLLTYIGNRYELIAQNGNELKPSRSIKKETSNRYYVTEKAYNEISKKYTIAIDL